MSFASDCKDELMTRKRNVIENRALLLGMLLSGSQILDGGFSFAASNEKITQYVIFLLKRLYKYEVQMEESNIQSKSFLHKYEVNCNGALHILEDLEMHQNSEFKNQIKENQNLSAAFLCGAFLARGSVNDPETTKYHFEIALYDAKNATFIQQVINNFDFNSKIVKRKNKLVIYVKDAEKIVDILRIMGANKSCFHYEDIRIERDLHNSINRIINCELANEQKTLSAANEQLKYIKYLEYNYPLQNLDPKLLTVMKARLDHPDASLNELLEFLRDEYGHIISKPGLSHRFAKIKEIAIEHKKNNN